MVIRQVDHREFFPAEADFVVILTLKPDQADMVSGKSAAHEIEAAFEVERAAGHDFSEEDPLVIFDAGDLVRHFAQAGPVAAGRNLVLQRLVGSLMVVNMPPPVKSPLALGEAFP